MAENGQNTVFINLTRNEVLEKLTIDQRLQDSFKRVMEKIQKYFNAHGYTSKVNYDEMLNKFLIPDQDIKEIKDAFRNSDEFNKYYNEVLANIERVEKELNIKIDSYDREKILDDFLTNKNFNVGLKIEFGENSLYNPKTNTISIGKDLLITKNFDEELCRQFIHFLTMCNEKEFGSIANQMKPVCYEALTEMITKEIMTGEKKDLSKITELIDYIGKVVDVKDYSAFLMRKLDEKYENNWLEFFEEAQNVFDKTNGMLGKDDIVALERKAIDNMSIELDKNVNNVEKYTEMLSKIKTIPNAEYDQEFINNFIEESIQKCIKANEISDEKAKEMIKNLVKIQEELGFYNSKDVHEYTLSNGEKIVFDKNGIVNTPDGKIVKPDNLSNPYHVEDNKLYIFNGNETIEFDLNNIDFGKRREELLSNKEELVKIIERVMTHAEELYRPNITEEDIKKVLERKINEDENIYMVGLDSLPLEQENGFDYTLGIERKPLTDDRSIDYTLGVGSSPKPKDDSQKMEYTLGLTKEQIKEQRRKEFYEKARKLGLDKQKVDLEKLFQEQEKIIEKEQEKDYGMFM